MQPEGNRCLSSAAIPLVASSIPSCSGPIPSWRRRPRGSIQLPGALCPPRSSSPTRTPGVPLVAPQPRPCRAAQASKPQAASFSGSRSAPPLRRVQPPGRGPAFTATFDHVRAPGLLRGRGTCRHLWSGFVVALRCVHRSQRACRPPNASIRRRSVPDLPPMRGVGVQGRPSRRQLTHPTPTYLAASSY
jgi:hypothetical protein